MPQDDRPWLTRLLNPAVPWWAAWPASLLAGAALLLEVLDPVNNLPAALVLLAPAAVLLYGTARVRWWPATVP